MRLDQAKDQLTVTTGEPLAVELGIFAIFWGIGWAFSRATKDELMLRWRGGIMPIVQGLGYALALRIGLGLVLVFVLVWIAMVQESRRTGAHGSKNGFSRM